MLEAASFFLNIPCFEIFTEKALDLDCYFDTTQASKEGKKFGTWNVRSMYREGSFTAAGRELARCKLDSVCVHEFVWDIEENLRAGDYNFVYGKGNEYRQLGTDFLYTTE